MAIPSFGPSQRLELSTNYLDCNSTDAKCDGTLLYDRVDPRSNVAEEGQVVLLSNNLKCGTGCDYHKTEVIPDAAGYPVDCSQLKEMSEDEKIAYLVTEISQYNVGVNQVERGVRSPHTSSGYGWDISLASNTGHPITIRHTGSDKIHRFDLIGIRFPTKEDVEAQTDRWNASGRNKGLSVCKFATYPVRENWELLKYNRFALDLKSFANDLRYGLNNAESRRHGSIRYSQLPALGKIVEEVKRMESNKETLTVKNLDDTLSDENLVKSLTRLAQSACNFNNTLRPPMVFAQCVSYQCVQPQVKSWAECGDLLNCVFL